MNPELQEVDRHSAVLVHLWKRERQSAHPRYETTFLHQL